jgi:hypothetical protein
MKKQNKSPLNMLASGLAATRAGGVPSFFNGGGGLAGLTRRMQAANAAKTQATAAASTMGSAPAPDPTTMGSAPASATMGSADGANPFEGRTFTISPAQMRNVENVFGDTNERQASVGQGMEQSIEDYDAYGEESPLMKKSCRSYKK